MRDETAIDARERGYKVTVLHDACASVDERVEQVALAYLRDVTGSFVVEAAGWRPGEISTGRARSRTSR